MVNWEKVRKEFSITKDKVYLMNAAQSPIPDRVLKRITKEYERLGLAGDIGWDEDNVSFRALCGKLGSLIGAPADDIAFLGNTSTGMSVVAMSLKAAFKDGFNIVSMMDEFPATTVPFEYQGIKMKYVQPQNARYPIQAVLDQVDDKTVAVVTSHVQYCTGFRQDIEMLGRKLKRMGKLFIVNATQSFPIYPINVGCGIDVMTASPHKWGCAGHVGSLFYTSPEFRERFAPPYAGWLSVVPDEDDFIYTKKGERSKLKDGADKYYFGCINLQIYGALAEAFDMMVEVGFENIRSRIKYLTDELIAGLKKRNINIISPVEHENERSAIVVFNTSGDMKKLTQHLASKNIFVSHRCGNIRASVNFYNNEQDIQTLLEAIGTASNPD